MTYLRPYQESAVSSVVREWDSGHVRVCLVAPTGSGKTVIGSELVRQRSSKTLWLAHRRELIEQAADKLRSAGVTDIGIILPGHDREPFASVQIASIQTLASRPDTRPEADLVVYDECHHYVASQWREISDHYAAVPSVGLTATPQRRDGRPLGDMFSSIVVAAQYSELLVDKHIVKCRVFRPDSHLGKDLANDPLSSWKLYARDGQTFGFASSVERCYELRDEFNASGIPAAVIEADTPQSERADLIDRFRRSEIRVLWNVYALTEGVDVPAATCCLLARGVTHAGGYLQMVGRVLRPADGKTEAVLIDLPGCSHVHGLPVADRDYHLEGRPINLTGQPLRVCAACGATIPAVSGPCPDCGYTPHTEAPALPRIYDMALSEVFAGADTPSDAKRREFDRLVTLARRKGWDMYFVEKEYKKLFGVTPGFFCEFPEDEQREQLAKFRAVAAERGFRPGYAAARFKGMFGRWPNRGW